MKTFLVILAVFLATLLSLSARADVPRFPKDEPYAKARVILMKKGWKPVHEPDSGFVCSKGDPRCEGRPETVACAGTGAANCIFRWKRKGAVIDINTVGEQDPIVTEVTCRSGCA